ncbi:MAG: FimV/HubP family polar landmark protein, partial [Rubrivivax sp.]
APAVAAAPRPAPAPMPAPAVASNNSSAPDRVRVEQGDTLGRIAERVRSSSVSLDQMLVALFRANPSAFMGDNMNRLKAGAVLEVPGSVRAADVDAGEARRVITTQSADFNSYRQRLAGTTGGADVATAAAPARQATGSVEATVDDRQRAAAPTPDKLQLAQGNVQASAAADGVSRQTETRDAAARVAELARNVEALKKLQGETAAPTAIGAGPGAAPAAAPMPAPAPATTVDATAPTVVAAAPTAPPAPAPTPAPTPAPAPAPKPTPAGAGEETGLLATLMGNPLVLPLAGVLIALLAGLGLYRWRSRAKPSGGETSFLESRLQPDSFFGASGGQRIDTRESKDSTSSSSSMSYSLSQLDAIGDVDPVAEADVYLAYGRDLQAEEILKEALRTTPDRQAIRIKLLEVYAKRRDAKAFELLATQVFAMTHGEGDDWARVQELGRTLDDGNALYRPGGQPDAVLTQGGKMIEPLGASTLAHTQRPASTLPPEVAALPTDLDLDVDMDLDATRPAPAAMRGLEPTEAMTTGARVAPAEDELSFDLPTTGAGALDFELPSADEPTRPVAPPAADPLPPTPELASLDFDLEAPPVIPAAEVSDGDRFPEFELSKSPDDVPSTSEYGNLNDNPLERKLELAEEFRQIGDVEGARDLLDEVIAKADGTLKSKAQGMLARLG